MAIRNRNIECTDTGGAGGERTKPWSKTPKKTYTRPTEEYSVSPEEVKREVRRQVYKDIKKGINEANEYLTNASNNIMLAMELLEGFSGKTADEIRNKIIQDLEEINRTGEKLNAINDRAIQKIRELGGSTADVTNSNEYEVVDIFKNWPDSSAYRCDTDVLRNQILPLLEAINRDLENARTATSNLPKAEGCEDIGNVSSQIDENQKANNNVQKEIKKGAEAAERMEERNRHIAEDIFNANPDLPSMEFSEEVIADAANTGASFLKGFFNVGESLFDAAVIMSTIMADSGSMQTGEFVPYEYGKGGVSDEAWKAVMGFVANDYVESAYKGFYEDTKAGQWLDSNASDIFKSTGAGTQNAAGLGETAGIAATTILTGGTGAGAMAAVAGAAGFGKYTEEYWGNARDNAAEGEEWATEEVRNNGIVYGAANGAWEAAQWYVGGNLNKWSWSKGDDIVSLASRVALDTAFNAADTVVRAGIDAATSDKTFQQAWDDQGGWKSVETDTTIGLIGSISGEIFNGKTMAEKISEAEVKMKEYFKEQPNLGITDEQLKEAFDNVHTCKTNAEFIKIAKEHGFGYFDSMIVDAFCAGREKVILRPSNSVETIIHEVNHALGGITRTIRSNTGALRYGVNTRGLDEALTESLALKITGIRGSGVSGYRYNVQKLNQILGVLEENGINGRDAASYYTKDKAVLANALREVTGDGDFYSELARNMDIADGFGDVKNPIKILEARIEIEGMIDNLKQKIQGGQ